MKFKFWLLGYILFFLDITLYLIAMLYIISVIVFWALGIITPLIIGLAAFISLITLLLANLLAPIAIQGIKASVEIEKEWEIEKKKKDNL